MLTTNKFSSVQGFGEDVSGELSLGARTYQVTVQNASTVIWNEVVVFYDLIDIPGAVVPLIAQGVFPPDSGLTFHLCPYDRLYSYVIGIFFPDINGDLLTISIPEEGSFPADVGSSDPCHPIFIVEF